MEEYPNEALLSTGIAYHTGMPYLFYLLMDVFTQITRRTDILRVVFR